MIVHPSYIEMMDKVNEGAEGDEPIVNSRYSIVMAASKRARQLIDGALPMIDRKDRKPLSCAVEEIDRGLLIYHRNLEDEEL